jgi:hypothetical protein
MVKRDASSSDAWLLAQWDCSYGIVEWIAASGTAEVKRGSDRSCASSVCGRPELGKAGLNSCGCDGCRCALSEREL